MMMMMMMMMMKIIKIIIIIIIIIMMMMMMMMMILLLLLTGLRSAVGNVSGYRCVSDCRYRGREFDPGPVPYFRGD